MEGLPLECVWGLLLGMLKHNVGYIGGEREREREREKGREIERGRERERCKQVSVCDN